MSAGENPRGRRLGEVQREWGRLLHPRMELAGGASEEKGEGSRGLKSGGSGDSG